MKAFCTDCNKLANNKEYAQATNPQILCENCGKRGGHIANPNHIEEKTIEQPPEEKTIENIFGQPEQEPEKKRLSDDEVITLDVEEINLNDDNSLKNFVPKLNIPKNVKSMKDIPIRIKLDKNTLRKLYDAVDEIGQKLEMKALDKKKPSYYGNSIFKNLYDVFSDVGSQISKQIDLPIVKLFVLGHIAILAPIPLFFMKSIRKLRGIQEENEIE